MTITLKTQALTKQGFAPFGEVIESAQTAADAMNSARFERFDDLCKVDLANDGEVAVSIARCRMPTSLPLQLEMLERHPLGSQAFIPLSPCKMVIVVAPAAERPDINQLQAFETDGQQGFNYRKGTWHMPLIAFEENQEFLIIDRGGQEANCDIQQLKEIVFLERA